MRALAIALLFAGALSAQEFRGTFSGTVTDAQGAAVAKAKIVATETRTGAKSETVSEASGTYTIPFLAPGEYEIAAACMEASEVPLTTGWGLSFGSPKI